MIRTHFTAYLYCTEAAHTGYVGISTCNDSNAMGSAEDDGWLRIEGSRVFNPDFNFIKPVRFLFECKEQVGERTHYNISCATDYDGFLGGKLGKSANGYLGLYGVSKTDAILSHISPIYWAFAQFAEVSFWKIEALDAWDGTVNGAEQVNLHLRDDNGLRVAALDPGGRGEYLNAGEGGGTVLTFQLRDIQQV